jgi:capsular polysaccharide biosynthesis protein
VQLTDYLVVLRKNWLLIALTALVTAASAFVFSKMQTPVYRSSVVLQVEGRVDYGTTLALNNQLRQLTDRIRTHKLAHVVDVRYQFDLGSERLLDKLHTQAFTDSTSIKIDVDDTDPQRAREIARGFAQEFVEAETAKMEGVPTTERRVVGLLDEPAPPRLHWPQTRVFVLSGLLLGALIGLVLAFAREYLDDSLKTPSDVERYLELPTLATIARVPAGMRGSAAPRASEPPPAARREEAGASAGRRLGRRAPRGRRPGRARG